MQERSRYFLLGIGAGIVLCLLCGGCLFGLLAAMGSSGSKPFDYTLF